MGKENLQPEDPNIAMLERGRDELIPLRNMLIASSVLIGFGNEEARNLGFNLWMLAFSKQEDIIKNLIAPAKKTMGFSATNKTVEDTVRENATVFAKHERISVEFAKGVVNYHIQATKEMQRELGVPRRRF